MFSNEKIENTYNIKGNLGSGSYGSVYIVEKKDTTQKYALKRINTSQLRHTNEYRRQMHEMNILFFNKCPYLLHALDVSYIREKYRLDIITELYDGRNLNNLISKYRAIEKSIPNSLIWTIFIQICLGIQYLHTNGVIHRDLKPANILLNDKDNPTKIVICDFGASICLLDDNAYCSTKIGTPYFMSPEQNNSNCYDKKTDIWSLGCILYELITLEKPFEANNINMLNQKITKGYYKPIELQLNNLDNQIWSFILKKMLTIDVKSRISVNTILDLPDIKDKLNLYNLIHNNNNSLDIPDRLNAKTVQSSYGLYHYIINLKDDYAALMIKPKSSQLNKENPTNDKKENHMQLHNFNKNIIKLPSIITKNNIPDKISNKPMAERLRDIIKQNRYLLGFYDPNNNREMAFDNVGLKSWKESVAELPDYYTPKKIFLKKIE
jgi:serine/threonine protein kinase